MTLPDQSSTTTSVGSPIPTRRRISLQSLLALAFMLITLLAGVITVLVLAFTLRNQTIEGFQHRLLDVASLASTRIDGDLHASLVDPVQEDGLEYNQVKQVLQEIRQVNLDEYRFVYTMRVLDDQVIFVVDAETNPTNISHLGDVYSDISPVLKSQLLKATGPFVDPDFTTDRWGTYLSGYAPIHTSDGRIDGFVGIDISAETIAAVEQRTFVLSGLVFLIVIPVIGFLGYRLSQRVTSPLLMVVRSAERLAGGDLRHRIQYEGWDEVHQLVDAFNKLAEQLSESIGDLEETLSTRTKEAEQRFEYLQTAADAGAAVGAILDPNRLINQVTNLIQNRFSLYYVGLFLVDETGDWAVLRAATGEAGEKMLARGHRIRIGEGMIGWSVQNNQARVASQVEQDAIRLRIPELPLTRSEAAIPLRSRERVLGALSVQSEQLNAFDRTSLFVLQMLADQVAVALDNARRLAQLQSELDDAQRSYQHLTQSTWDALLLASGPVGYRADLEGLSPVTRINVETGQDARPISEDGFTLTVPVRVRGQVLGYLQADRPASVQSWTDEDLALVDGLLEQLGVALDNARLYSAAQRSADRERVLSTITGRVRSSTSVDSILQTAVRQLAEALKVPRGSIRLLSSSDVEKND